MQHRPGRKVAGLLVAACTVVALLMSAAPASATITSVFNDSPWSSTASPIPCAVQGSGVRLCDQTIAGNPDGTARSTVPAFDGVPIDIRAAFPPEPASGPDGPYPLIMLFHGYAGSKLSLASMQPFLDKGYATLSMTTRGFGQSCGTAASRTALGAPCNNGYVRLMDTRYEVRDAQELAGTAGRRGPHFAHPDRRDRRLLRRRALDGARGPEEPHHASGWFPDRVAEPERHADADRGGNVRRSRGRTSPLARPERQARSTTSTTRPTRAAPVS